MIVVYEQCMSYLIHRSSLNIASPLSALSFPRPALYIGFRLEVTIGNIVVL